MIFLLVIITTLIKAPTPSPNSSFSKTMETDEYVAGIENILYNPKTNCWDPIIERVAFLI